MREIAKIAGLIPFLWCTNAPLLAFVIVTNGVLCHGSSYLRSSLESRLKRIDIVTNVALTIYVNTYSSWCPQTQLCTLVAVCMWSLNNVYFNKSATIHVLLVQGVLCNALIHF